MIADPEVSSRPNEDKAYENSNEYPNGTYHLYGFTSPHLKKAPPLSLSSGSALLTTTEDN